MRKGLAAVVLVSSVILLACYLSRPKPLRPLVVTWNEIGKVDDFFLSLVGFRYGGRVW